MTRRLAAFLGLLAWLVSVVDGKGVLYENDDLDREGSQNDSDSLGIDPKNAVGNSAYSILGFILGGSLLFVTLFDPTRKPIIQFFDSLFGAKAGRRRRETGTGLESHVAAAFDAVSAALDKMEIISKIAQK
ncbi:hypothetical protein SK128_024733 [Halocaridina rubra]|uniref:Uncharacterized protein n=1 Tax=Halocaridina rubra TaxID=373956 RepID=A0AAN8WIE8_HALRR